MTDPNAAISDLLNLAEEQALVSAAGTIGFLCAAKGIEGIGEEIDEVITATKAYPSTKRLNKLLTKLARLTAKGAAELARGMKLADV